jgi:hypothetical protein
LHNNGVEYIYDKQTQKSIDELKKQLNNYIKSKYECINYEV